MGQIAAKPKPVASRRDVQGKIRKLTEHLSSRQKSAVLKTSKVLVELSASQRRAALDIIRQRDKNGGLDYSWLTSFLTVLSKLKAEQSHSKAE